ncbi:unnamed protein product, partial [Nesidiocoris tenuis]
MSAGAGSRVSGRSAARRRRKNFSIGDFVLSQPSAEVLGRLANDDDLIRRLHDFSCKAEVTPDAAAVGKIVETLMRQLTPEVLERILTTVDDGIDTEIGSNCVDLLAWTVKSLILRNHKSSTNWMRKWVFQWIYDDQLMSLFNEGGESTKKAAALAIINIVLAVPTNLVAAEITK